MNMNQFTQRSLAAIQGSQELAVEHGNQQIEQEHLLLDRAPHLKTTRWHPNFLDVIPPTGGKDLGMDAILDHFGIPLENCMAFGDGENDLSMLIHAGIGVAMGTASGAVKAQADYTAHRWTRMELPVPCPTSACSPEPESSSPNQPKFTNCYWNYPRIRCTI